MEKLKLPQGVLQKFSPKQIFTPIGFVLEFDACCLLTFQILVEEATRLQALYPGSNVNQIAQKQEMLITSWEDLKQKSDTRKRILQDSCDHQRFLSQVSLHFVKFLNI